MDIVGAIKAGFEFAKLWAARAWGTQTRDQSAVERDIANAREKKALAFEDLRHARGDEQIRAALRAVNYWDTELTRLHREAAAKWP